MTNSLKNLKGSINTVSIAIEHYKNEKNITYLEAIKEWADENDIEYTDINSKLSGVLIDKLKQEQVNLNAVKPENASTTSTLDQWL